MQMARYSVKPSYLFPRSQSPVSNLTLFTLYLSLFSLLPPSHFPLFPSLSFFFYLNSQRSFKNVPSHLSLWHRQPSYSSILGPFCPREPNCTWRMVLSPAVRCGPRGAAENPLTGGEQNYLERPKSTLLPLCLWHNMLFCFGQCQTCIVTKIIIIFRWKTVVCITLGRQIQKNVLFKCPPSIQETIAAASPSFSPGLYPASPPPPRIKSR